MAAGLGFKTFTTGEVLTAADTNGYLMQGVLVFASTAARDAAITSPQEGQFAFTKDTDQLWYRSASAWVASGATGDIEGVTAGIGISGGGTSGTVTVTNSMATAIDSKGDLVAGTAADTFARLAVGANNSVLTADSAEATGLKWATASAGGYTTLASGSLSGNDLTLSSISQSYKELRLVLNDFYVSASGNLQITVNGDSGSYYTSIGLRGQWDTTTQTTTAYSAIGYNGTYAWLGNGANIATNNFANTAILDFPNYASTDTWKTWNEYYFIQSNSNGTSRFGYCSDHYYPATPAAISSIKIKVESSNTFSGGTYTLLGLS